MRRFPLKRYEENIGSDFIIEKIAFENLSSILKLGQLPIRYG